MAPPASASAKAPTKSQAWLYLLFFSSTLEILAISLTIPSYPKLMKDVGMTLQGQTLVTSLISLVTFFMTPILGRLSDRIGRTLVLRLSSLGQLCVNLMLARFTRWEYVAAARLMAGFTRAFTPVSYAYISDHTGPEDRGKAMGVFGSSIGLAFVIGPLVGGLIEKRYDTRRPFLVGAVVGLTNAWLVGKLPEAKRKDEGKEEKGDAAAEDDAEEKKGTLVRVKELLVKDPRLGALLAGRFVMMCCGVLFESTFSQYVMDVLQGDSGVRGRILGVMGLAGIVANGYVVRKFGATLEAGRVLAAAMVVYAAGNLGWAYSLTPAHLSITLVPLVLSSMSSTTVTKSLISKSCGADIMGFVMGLSGSLDTVCRIVVPPAAGYIYEKAGPRACPFVGVGLALLAGACFFLGDKGDDAAATTKKKKDE